MKFIDPRFASHEQLIKEIRFMPDIKILEEYRDLFDAEIKRRKENSKKVVFFIDQYGGVIPEEFTSIEDLLSNLRNKLENETSREWLLKNATESNIVTKVCWKVREFDSTTDEKPPMETNPKTMPWIDAMKLFLEGKVVSRLEDPQTYAMVTGMTKFYGFSEDDMHATDWYVVSEEEIALMKR